LILEQDLIEAAASYVEIESIVTCIIKIHFEGQGRRALLGYQEKVRTQRNGQKDVVIIMKTLCKLIMIW
jgi:hypothetical protein